MSIGKLEVGDMIITNTDTGKRVEIVQYVGASGNLLYLIKDPDVILECNRERFVKFTDSQPYSVRIVKKFTQDYLDIINEVTGVK